MRVTPIASFAIAAVAAVVGRVHAEPVNSSKVTRADQLFAEGKALLASNLIQACGKFDQSLRENPAAIGTLLNVALCDEKLGRIASAVAKFSEARDRAIEQGLREHVRAAEEHIAALGPSIPYLAIKLTEQLPGTTVVLDDAVIAVTALDHIAVDPGERVIVVSAPSRLPYRTTLIIGKAERRDVTVPVLAASIVVHSSLRRIGQISTIGGGVLMGTGLGIGLYARNLYRAQFGHQVTGDGKCNDMNHCEAYGQSRTQRAHTLGNVGTVVGLLGVGVTVAGAYLWFSAPSESATEPAARHLGFAPQLGPDGLGLAAVGRF
jgi:hypothetical protein